MATKYWVGGDGNWSSATNWRTTSGGLVVTTAPGSSDAAVLDGNSGTSIITIDSNITIQTLNCTGFTGTLAFGTNTITLNSTGNLFIGATTMSVSGTPLIILNNATTTATRTINASAVTEANSISFNITAGSGTAVITVTGGGAVRDLNFTGYSGSHNATSYTMYGSLTLSSGMTVTAGSTTTFAATSGTKTITTNGITFDKGMTFNGIGGTFQFQDALTLGSTRAFTITNGTVQLKSGTTNTVGSLVTSGTNQKFLQSTVAGTQATISDASGTNTVSLLTIQDINATGGATYEAFFTSGNVNAGNNSGWDFAFEIGNVIYTRRKNKRYLY